MGNFWGDLDGDGQQTPWDDTLGDLILYDIYQAQERARRGEPPEPEDEDLLGDPVTVPQGYRRRGSYRSSGQAGNSSLSQPMALFLMLLVGACFFLVLWVFLTQ
jgi:hypothetical protein